ncbi:MAG TPA: hypothetical protein VFF03_17060 [Rhodocyclaceae bacterium]|nr:hypothetical protein [Rhodocyclaceae bacterium]
MAIRFFVLQTQYDIIDFRLGNRPATILVRDFATEAESRAYEDGIDAISDEYDRIDGLKVEGAKVSYARRRDDPEADIGFTEGFTVEFGTPAEAEAFCLGLGDSEGFAAPLLIDDSDDRFDQLQLWGCS